MSGQGLILFYGRLGKKPELKYTQKQEPVCYLAVAEQIEGKEKPTWHKVVVWGKQAEQCNLFLEKGAAVFVRGRNLEREFTTKEGATKTYQEVKAETIGFPVLL